MDERHLGIGQIGSSIHIVVNRTTKDVNIGSMTFAFKHAAEVATTIYTVKNITIVSNYHIGVIH